ncbi:hypothetical protein B0H67DRAFT_66311 [Lasiosphaeris hirsuta]|uniref:PSI domain-containing protein n=1 Tax=Lasiosphaeris hirsuta TaxID=260670 RepID=A0AA40BBU2_9PEZI|nr:hypothetical protein B0H67DRAFT_66311 [Lasiosphaeris hirsuta]
MPPKTQSPEKPTAAMNESSNGPADEHLLRCWRQQYCGGCLGQDKCSWCPFTQSCVPNDYPIQLLAPAYDENICPHWAERWEIRTHPFGCQVSTISSLTSIISIVSTLAFVLLVWLGAWAIRRLRKYHGGQEPGWWKVWASGSASRLRVWQPQTNRSQEQEPLLGT